MPLPARAAGRKRDKEIGKRLIVTAVTENVFARSDKTTRIKIQIKIKNTMVHGVKHRQSIAAERSLSQAPEAGQQLCMA